jgi:uncharacterized protein (UPF0335 family)
MTTGLQKSAQEELKRLVDQIERLEGEKKDIADDIKDKWLEVRSKGFDAKVLRKIIKMRKQPKTDRDEEQAIIDVYLHALGMDGTPLDAWAKGNEADHGLAN